VITVRNGWFVLGSFTCIACHFSLWGIFTW